MTSTKDEDYVHPNTRGNGPKARMEGGDKTDDIWINDPDSRLLAEHNHLYEEPDKKAERDEKISENLEHALDKNVKKPSE